MLLMLMASLYVPGNMLGQITLNISGAGTETAPYQIDSPEALAWFRDWVNGTYTPDGGTAVTHPEACAKLTADIDMSTICHPADKANDKEELSWVPISDNNVKWKGSFDGGGHTISNLYINSTSQYSGLFGYVGDNAANDNANKSTYIKDIAFSNIKATFTNQFSGTLAGYIGNVSVSGITVESGTINGKSILGGIVGKAYYSVISNCINKVNIESEQNVGGICGILDYSTIEGCANYGTIEISSIRAGGIAGFTFTSTIINNCANYGNIIGSQYIGGIIGTVCRTVKVDNDVSLLFSCGNVTCDKIGGMLFGSVIGFLHINGAAIYSSDAVLTLGGSPVETVAIGEKYFIYDEYNCKGYNTNLINSGIVTWLLQNGNENEIWGQDLSGESKEPYPVLGSKKVYPVGDVHFDCSNTIILGGSFSNTDSGGKYTDIPYRDYHEFGSNGLCVTCGFAAPEVTEGDNSIPVKAVPTSGTLENQMGYTIYKYVATSDGTLYITSEGESDTYGTLWDAGFTLLASNDNKCVGETNFFISYDVVKGTTYFIGIREKSGVAIDGTCSLKIAGAWSPDDGLKKPIDLLGIGTQESPFELKNAKHLLWFSHYVNGTYEPETGATASFHPEACAKMIADIDLSSVCHPADAENSVEEVSWIPISNINRDDVSDYWHGTFDGGGHTISNLYCNCIGYAGLFGCISGDDSNPGTIKDIVFTNVSIDNYNSGGYAGAVAAMTGHINISGILVESGNIDGADDAGGIVGNYAYAIISNCSNKINITSRRSDAGGICGKYAGNDGYNINNCANYGNISGAEDAGGIVGFSYWTTTIKDVFSSGDVTISTSGKKSFGLIVGLNRDKLIFDGVIAFNKEATLKNSVDGIIEGKAVGEISDGATLTGENIPQGFTKDQQRSGYLTYVVMNNGKTDGTQAWYQKLGEDGDAWPVLKNTGSNTVYRPNYCTCDGKTVLNTCYSNSPDNLTAPHVYQPSEEENAETKLHDYVCTVCSTHDSEHKAIKDFNKAGEYLQINVGEDGSYSVDELTLYDTNDAKLYNSPVALNVGNLTYVRQLTHGGFSPLYVPFALTPEQCDGELNLYAINNFHERENAEGGYDVTLEVKKVTAGNTMANRPYVFKPQNYSDENKTVTLNLGETTLQPRQNSSISCCSMSYTYTFNGTYDAKALNSASDYAMYQGEIRKVSDNVTISPQRWYLTVTDRDGYETGGGSSANAKAMAFTIYENGEGEATAIEDIRVVNDFPSSAAGIYDLQGRKLSKEPVKGMYIKNGVKYVK